MNVRLVRCIAAMLLASGAAQAALVDRGGGFIYDDVLDVTWLQDANYAQTSEFDGASAAGLMNWDTAAGWAASLNFGGVTGWRLPSMDVNGDGNIVSCTADQTACQDNELGHLFNYGAGAVFGSGITSSNPGPFINIPASFPNYWSGTDGRVLGGQETAWLLRVDNGNQGEVTKSFGYYAWAVRNGDVGVVPIPAAVWLFASALGLLGWVRRKTA